MTDSELLLSLVEIAGVFVGFRALIAIRTGGATDTAEVAYMRGVVSMGMLAVIAALAPVLLSRYGLAAHQVWTLGCILVLVGWAVLIVSMSRTPEYRANMSAEFEADRSTRPRWVVVLGTAAYLLYVVGMLLGPIVIVLGVWPEFEAPLYATVVVLILLGAGWSLFTLVFSHRGPQQA